MGGAGTPEAPMLRGAGAHGQGALGGKREDGGLGHANGWRQAFPEHLLGARAWVRGADGTAAWDPAEPWIKLPTSIRRVRS